jgi:hypothetical protein
MTAVRQSETYVPNVPFFILDLLQDLDPHIWDSHSEPIVKPNTAQRYREAQGWHSGHIFRDCDRLRI